METQIQKMQAQYEDGYLEPSESGTAQLNEEIKEESGTY